MKTPPYQKKANDAYVKRHGYVQYNRRIKPEWKEAEQHLKSNAHHYSKQAHVYCKHAWRAPKTEKLLMLLKDLSNG